MTQTGLALTGSPEIDMAQAMMAPAHPSRPGTSMSSPPGGLRTTAWPTSPSSLPPRAARPIPNWRPPLPPCCPHPPVAGADSIGLGWFITPTGRGRSSGTMALPAASAVLPASSGRAARRGRALQHGDRGRHRGYRLPPARSGLPLREQPKPRQAVEVDPAVLPGLAGDYLLAPAVFRSITTEDGRLFAQLTGQTASKSSPIARRNFSIAWWMRRSPSPSRRAARRA